MRGTYGKLDLDESDIGGTGWFTEDPEEVAWAHILISACIKNFRWNAAGGRIPPLRSQDSVAVGRLLSMDQDRLLQGSVELILMKTLLLRVVCEL